MCLIVFVYVCKCVCACMRWLLLECTLLMEACNAAAWFCAGFVPAEKLHNTCRFGASILAQGVYSAAQT